MGKLRALWLMNHTTLRAFEVPLLIDMGFEVFCSKIYPDTEDNLSANIDYTFDYTFDYTLTIPSSLLKTFNETDFYNAVDEDILEDMNRYFDVAFCSFFPKQLRMLVEGFKGVLIMQPFGLTGKLSYTEVIEEYLGISFMENIRSMGERFIFAQAYENIAEIEDEYIKSRAMYLPIGIKDAQLKNCWTGGEKKILFVCPRIETSPYFHLVYENFLRDFEDFDYLVCGAQAIVVNNPKVVGFLSKEEYEYNMLHLGVMYYHSREPRHLHYHPLEAVKYGMPLVYMQGGQLERLAGKKLPGACDTVREARRKIRRILKGDKRFIQKVVKHQEILLKPFTYAYCKQYWEEEFVWIKPLIQKIKMQKQTGMKEKHTKIGVIIPLGYIGGVLDMTFRMIKCIKHGIQEDGKNVKIVLGHLEDENYQGKHYFSDLENGGVEVRTFQWKVVDGSYIKNTYQYMNLSLTPDDVEYAVLDDGINFFQDCDFLILMAGRSPARFFSYRPYIVMGWEYVPGLFKDEFNGFILNIERNAKRIFASTEPTIEMGIQYYGIPKEKFLLIPPLYESIGVMKKGENRNKEYFVWSTNISPHKNHRNAMEGLAKYYQKGGRITGKITGAFTNQFKNSDQSVTNYVKKIRSIIKRNPILVNHIEFTGYIPIEQFYELLADAKFLFHPGMYDNGNGAAIDAAFLNVPTLTNDYPQMRYYDNLMNLKFTYMDGKNPESICEKLFEMEVYYEKKIEVMPRHEDLERFTISHTYRSIYEAIKREFDF